MMVEYVLPAALGLVALLRDWGWMVLIPIGFLLLYWSRSTAPVSGEPDEWQRHAIDWADNNDAAWKKAVGESSSEAALLAHLKHQAANDADALKDRVSVQLRHFMPKLDAPEPYIDFVFLLTNANVYTVKMSKELSSDAFLTMDGQGETLLTGARDLFHHVNVSHGGRTEVRIRQVIPEQRQRLLLQKGNSVVLTFNFERVVMKVEALENPAITNGLTFGRWHCRMTDAAAGEIITGTPA